VRDALVRSKNVPTIRLAESVGIDRVAEFAEHAGVEPPIPREPSMPLGTVAVNPLELATAYTAFARLGTAVKPRLVTRVETPEGELLWEGKTETHDVLRPATAFLIDDVLQEALARGTGTAVRESGFSAPAAGKTGTTNDGADAWFVGYTPDAVAAVWVGYDDPAPIVPRATGGRLAAPVWARVMLRLYQARPRPAGWAKPSDVVEAWIDPGTGQRLTSGCRPLSGWARRELFLASHVPSETCPASGSPAVMTAEVLPMEGYEEFTGAPDVPPVEMERTRVPVEDDSEDAAAAGEDVPGEAESDTAALEPAPPASPAPRLRVSPAPRATLPAEPAERPPSPRAVATPRPEPAEEQEPPAEEPRAATPAPTPTPTPGASR
jgi:penicillin-binding protein 1A